jgi:hypothetical protein
LETWIDLPGTLAETVEGEFADLITLSDEMDAAGKIPSFGRLLVKEMEL